MKAEDKSQIMQTLTTLTNSITKLQEEIKSLSSANVLKTAVKSKAQVHTLTPCQESIKINNFSHSCCYFWCLFTGSEGASGHRVGPL